MNPGTDQNTIDLLYDAHLNVRHADFGPDDMSNFFAEHLDNDDVSYVEQVDIEEVEPNLYRVVFNIGVDIPLEDGGYDVELFECVTYGSLEYDENDEPFYDVQRVNEITALKDKEDYGDMPDFGADMFPLPAGASGLFTDMFEAMMGGNGPGLAALFGDQRQSESSISNVTVIDESNESGRKRFIVEFDTDAPIAADDVKVALTDSF